MSNEDDSPWARRPADQEPAAVVVLPPAATATPPVVGAPLARSAWPGSTRGETLGAGMPSGRVRPSDVGSSGRVRPSGVGSSGRVRPSGALGSGWPSPAGAPQGSSATTPAGLAAPSGRRTQMWFGASAAAVLVVGLVIILGMALSGNSSLRPPSLSGPHVVAPPLARACPPPSGALAEPGPVPPAPAGPRTVDSDTGISYARYGAPWLAWNTAWDAGDLHVRYAVGQHFVTEHYSMGAYHASILSGSVPATVNDALSLDLPCTGHQVLADVRASYYPQPNTIDMMRDEVTQLGGRPAWVAKFRLHFHAGDLHATSELVGVALIDVGRPNAAIIYVSIPNTVGQYDHIVDEVLASVRPT